ncbi:MAG: dTDP-4-dehydrorhamnose reductase [Acidimicrobiales bacterium]
MRVLVTGAGGQLGHDLVTTLSGHQVVGADRRVLDVADRDAVLSMLGVGAFDVVINAAAWTEVDACEADPDRAFRDNALAVRHLAEGCRRFGAHLVQVSTDYVFDGTLDRPYTEWDEPNPRSVYGRSKLAGEREVGPGATVVRTSWVCGVHGANMVKTVLRLAAGDGPLRFVDDQRGHPTCADDLAAMIARLAVDRRPGVFHVTNQGDVSWYEFAREVLQAAGQDPDRVQPVATDDLRPARPAPRPANSVLDNAALRGSGLALLDDFRVPLRRLVAALT